MTDGTAPVTATQFEQLLQAALEPMKQNMATKEDLQRIVQKTDKQFAWLRDGIDQTLSILWNMEKKFGSNIANHEHRIKRLEKKAGLAQIV